MNFLDRTIDKINRESKLCVIMGDFNMNLLNIDSHQPTEEFLNTLGTYFFTPHILQPTWITDHSATLIDNIFFNSISHHTISGNLIYDLTDHLPNFLIINKFTTLPKHFKMYKRDYSNYDECKLIDDLEMIDWHVELPQTNDVNTIFGSFYSKLSNIINKHIPLKLISRKKIKHMSKLWITSAIRVSLLMSRINCIKDI